MADTLERARAAFARVAKESGLDEGAPVRVVVLTPDEAIGPEADASFPIKRGKERVIEARVACHRGQAFTDQPSPFAGTLGEVLAMDLTEARRRAIFVAAMNAALSAAGIASGTVHCTDDAPCRCGKEIAQMVHARHGGARVGLIGLQPAILAGLARRFGAANVRVVDLNPENIGSRRNEVPVWDGATELPRLVEWCEVGLCTGSSLVNATLDDIAGRFAAAGKPLLFFGNTISGAAALLGLPRLCPYAA